VNYEVNFQTNLYYSRALKSVSHEQSQEKQNKSSSIINKPYPKEHREEMKIQKRQKPRISDL